MLRGTTLLGAMRPLSGPLSGAGPAGLAAAGGRDLPDGAAQPSSPWAALSWALFPGGFPRRRLGIRLYYRHSRGKRQVKSRRTAAGLCKVPGAHPIVFLHELPVRAACPRRRHGRDLGRAHLYLLLWGGGRRTGHRNGGRNRRSQSGRRRPSSPGYDLGRSHHTLLLPQVFPTFYAPPSPPVPPAHPGKPHGANRPSVPFPSPAVYRDNQSFFPWTLTAISSAH